MFAGVAGKHAQAVETFETAARFTVLVVFLPRAHARPSTSLPRDTPPMRAGVWFELPQRLGNQLGKLVGAKDGEVVVTDTTSVNLFKVLAAALRKQQAAAPHKRVIVSERRNFPTDLYIAQGLIDQLHAHGAPAYELRLIDAPEELAHALKEDVAVLMLTHVNYQTGYMYDMAATTAQAHQHGAVDIGKTIHPHPTLGESIGMAAEVAHGSCTDVPPARK